MEPDRLANRGNNLLPTGALAALALGMITEIPQEDGWWHRADEVGVTVVAAMLAVWYFLGQNRFRRSVVPLAMVTAALVVTVVGLALEFNDIKDQTDDIALAQVLLALLIITGILVYRAQPATPPRGSEAAATREESASSDE